MTSAQVEAAIALTVTLIVSWAALQVAIALLLPAQTDRAERTLTSHPWRCAGIGLGVLVVALIGAAALRTPGSALIGIILLVVPTVSLAIGSAAIAQLLGRRIAERSEASASFRTLAFGSIIYSLAGFFPIIGWYVFAPIAALCAFGSGLSSLLPERQPAVPPSIVPPSQMGGPEAA